MRTLRLSFAACVCIATVSGANALGAESWTPSRPVRFFVPFTAGGLGDTVARGVGQHLSERLGQPVVVENRPGASEVLAVEPVTKAPADGQTLLLATEVANVFNPLTKKSLPYDPQRDLTSIALLIESPFYLVLHPSVPAQNVAELVALAKSRPGKLSFASIGMGSMQHLLGELFKQRTQVDLLHVPYKGSGPAFTDVLGGQVDLMFQGGGGTLAAMRSGKVRALAATSAKRPAETQNLPTMAEAGVQNFQAVSWFGIFGPAQLPRVIVDRVNHETVEFLKLPQTRTKFAPLGVELVPTTPEGLAERIRRETPFWAAVIRDARIEPE
jgi:tripartite-type tricarboxylate transporter receptor subunit TctC